jgi:hypothetical protein
MSVHPNRASLAPCSPPSRTPSAPRSAVAARSLTAAAPGADRGKRSGRRNGHGRTKKPGCMIWLRGSPAAKAGTCRKKSWCDRSIQNARHSVVPSGFRNRKSVRSSRRGNHLGSGHHVRSNRTYDRKRSDNTPHSTCKQGAVHIWELAVCRDPGRQPPRAVSQPLISDRDDSGNSPVTSC